MQEMRTMITVTQQTNSPPRVRINGSTSVPGRREMFTTLKQMLYFGKTYSWKYFGSFWQTVNSNIIYW